MTADRRRRRRWIVGIAVLVPVAYVLFTFTEVWWASRADFTGRSDAVVVLGAAQYDGEPSPVLEARLDHAFEMWDGGRAPHIVLTGAKREGDRFTEAYAGFRYLRAKGVPEEDLTIVADGTSTWESLAASRRVLDRLGVEQVVLVSDRYHSARLTGIANEVGLDAEVSPTDQRPSFVQLVRESGKVAVGRLIGYRRVTRLTE